MTQGEEPRTGAEPCLVCAKHRGQGPLVGPVVFEDALVVVSLRTGGPPGYAFVETRRHVGRLEELSLDEAAAVGRTTALLARALTRELDARHVHTFVAGLGVDHFHQHVFVRPAATPPDAPWWPPPESSVDVDPAALAHRLAPHLA